MLNRRHTENALVATIATASLVLVLSCSKDATQEPPTAGSAATPASSNADTAWGNDGANILATMAGPSGFVRSGQTLRSPVEIIEPS